MGKMSCAKLDKRAAGELKMYSLSILPAEATRRSYSRPEKSGKLLIEPATEAGIMGAAGESSHGHFVVGGGDTHFAPESGRLGAGA
ncbi:MAG: hypothetical protein HRF43_17100 [Phycisphaerae bacterium]|jgi:hypothetical protein